MSQARLKMLTVLTAVCALVVAETSTSPLGSAQGHREQKLVAQARELGHSHNLSNTQKLIELLKNSSDIVRIAAAENLGDLLDGYGDPANAVTTGGENLGEIVEGMAQRARRATLAPLQVAGFRSALLTAANDTSAPLRAAAINALRRIFASDNPKTPPHTVKQAIASHLKDADPGVVLAAMRAAFFLHIGESRGDLIANLTHENADVREGAAQALALMGFSETAIPIAKLLKDRQADVRSSAANDLLFLCSHNSCDPAIGAALVEALSDGDEHVRHDVAHTIVVMKIPEGRQPLASALEEDVGWGLSDFSETDARQMAEFLRLDVTKEIEMLGRQLSKGPPSVRARSATLLGSLRDRRAAPLLFEALKSTDDQVLSAVIRSVPEVTPEVDEQTALERLRQIASLPDSALVDTLQQQVPKLKDRAMFGIALSILRNQTLSTYGVCSLLPRMCAGRWEFTVHPNLFESRESLRAKLAWLEVGDPSTSLGISSALVIAGAKEGLRPISHLLTHPDEKVRAHAAEALFWMCVDGLCDDAIVPSLLEALGSRPTRGNAARTLAYLNKREAVQAVMFALQQDATQDSMGLAEYWEADEKNLMDFLGKDNLKKLLDAYRANGPAAARRQAERFLAEMANGG